MEEIWKPVVGYEGLYEVSSLGRVKSLARYSKPHNNHGTICRSRIRERIMKGTPDEDGYLDVALTDPEGIQKYYRINRLVAIAFIPNPDNLPQVDHINNIKDDNRVENLAWVTCKETINKAWRDGRCTPPVPDAKAIERFRLLGKRMIEWQGTPCRCVEDNTYFMTVAEAAKYYEVSESTMYTWINNPKVVRKTCVGLHFEYISKDTPEYQDMLIKFRNNLMS